MSFIRDVLLFSTVLAGTYCVSTVLHANAENFVTAKREAKSRPLTDDEIAVQRLIEERMGKITARQSDAFSSTLSISSST